MNTSVSFFIVERCTDHITAKTEHANGTRTIDKSLHNFIIEAIITSGASKAEIVASINSNDCEKAIPRLKLHIIYTD